jgi:hypothetical protein
METIFGTLAGGAIGLALAVWILKKFFKKDLFQNQEEVRPDKVLQGAVKEPLPFSGFEGRALMVFNGFYGPAVSIDGQKVKALKGKYILRDNFGKERSLSIHSSLPFIDPLHYVEIESVRVDVQKPLGWYEYFWGCWPMALLFIGGAIGATLGFVAGYCNLRIFRSALQPALNYLFTMLISFLSVFLWLISAAVIHGVFNSR